MRLTDRQAEAYRELVAECGGPAEAYTFWQEHVAGRWADYSRPLTEAENMLMGVFTGLLAFGTIATLAKNPEFVTKPLDEIRNALEFVAGEE